MVIFCWCCWHGKHPGRMQFKVSLSNPFVIRSRMCVFFQVSWKASHKQISCCILMRIEFCFKKAYFCCLKHLFSLGFQRGPSSQGQRYTTLVPYWGGWDRITLVPELEPKLGNITKPIFRRKAKILKHFLGPTYSVKTMSKFSQSNFENDLKCWSNYGLLPPCQTGWLL